VRRQPAAIATNAIGLAIAKTLLGTKLRGPARVARQVLLRPDLVKNIDTFALALKAAEDLDECRSYEAISAEVFSPPTRGKR
jgi:hypothetical protein